VDVDLSATAGILTASQVTTNDSGTATFTFSAGPEKSNQVVVITAKSATSTKDLPITLSGTALNLTSVKSSLLAGNDDSTSLTVKAVDANNTPIPDAAITLMSAMGNQLAAGSATGSSVKVTTGALGTATATLTALDNIGIDTITASGLGTEAELEINVTNALFGFIAPAENTTIPVGTTTNLSLKWTDVNGNPVSGQTVTFTTTGGYFDYTSGKTSTTASTDAAGQTVVGYTASNIGTPADITATAGGESDTLRLFVAAIDPNQLSLQASPSVLRPSINDVTSTSTITAIVRDPSGQLVSGQTVVFTLVAGPGGGESISPGTAITDASGTATVSFISGSATSAQDGVIIRAIVQSKPSLYAETKLTIGNKATSIVLGTTNVISEEVSGDPPLIVGYALPFSVLVVDSNGNPISNAAVNLGAYPTYFYTGRVLDPNDKYIYNDNDERVGTGIDGPDPRRSYRFMNEDRNRNGFLDQGLFEDSNCNGFLDQGEDLNANGALDPEDGALGWSNPYALPNVPTDLVWVDGSLDLPAKISFYRPDPSRPNLCVKTGNGSLDPGGVIAIPKTVVTDSDGLASFELKYAKGFSYWVDVEITASTQVFGDLASTKMVVPLDAMKEDPPYSNSPFGL
jgi:hypothetical protein